MTTIREVAGPPLEFTAEVRVKPGVVLLVPVRCEAVMVASEAHALSFRITATSESLDRLTRILRSERRRRIARTMRSWRKRHLRKPLRRRRRR